jgi:hypothetical protein
MVNLSVKAKLAFMGEYTTVVHVVFKPGPILIIEGLEYMVHELLHHSGAVGRSKWHDCRGI